MKNTFVLIGSSLLLLTFSCKKNTGGNESIIKQEEVLSENNPSDSSSTAENTRNSKTQEYTDRYVAEDGSSALVTFKNTDQEKTISIHSNNKTISAKEKQKTSGGSVYENYDFKIKVENDSIKITQGSNVILLKKARVH